MEIEPKLLPVTGEAFDYQTASTSNEAKVDIQARAFWERGQQAFFDVKVFEPNANRCLKTALPQCYIQNEKEKKQNYINRVLQTEGGSFTPLVFSIFGGKCRECRTFYTLLPKLIADK